MDKAGIVYVLSHPAMPGIVKIGLTSRENVENRMRELFTTSVPVPFDCEFACKVDDCSAVENALHIAFNPSRIHPQREFFKIDPEQAIAILKLLQKEDVTPEFTDEINQATSAIDRDAGEKLKRQKRPPLNFFEMGIAAGEVLEFTSEDKLVEAVVVAEKKVKCNGQEFSLTQLTRELFGLDYNIQPTRFWTYKGKNLAEVYDGTYGE